MGKFIDFTNKSFGNLTVLRKDVNRKSNCTYWICRCKCGNIKSIRAQHLTNGKIISCGCHRTKVSSQTKIVRNKIEICDDYAKIYFPNSENFTIVDIADIDHIKNYCWNINHYGYISTHTNKNKRLLLHRLIMRVQDKKGCVVDHINHNKLDNRKNNLRVFENNTFNLHNIKPSTKSKTKIRNIYFRRGKYFVRYKRFGKTYYLGVFDSLDTAKKELKRSLELNNFIYAEGIL